MISFNSETSPRYLNLPWLHSPPPFFTANKISHSFRSFLHRTSHIWPFFPSPLGSVIQSWLCDPLDCIPPGSSVLGDSPARILEWVAMPSSRGSSQPRNQTQVSHITGKFFTVWTTRGAFHPTAAAVAAQSLQSCPTLCDPIDGSPPGSPSLGFSRQEHWSRLPFPSPTHYCHLSPWSEVLK